MTKTMEGKGVLAFLREVYECFCPYCEHRYLPIHEQLGFNFRCHKCGKRFYVSSVQLKDTVVSMRI